MAIKQNDEKMYETTINGAVYEFAKWGASDAIEGLLDLSALIGKPLTLLAKAVALSRKYEKGKAADEGTFDTDSPQAMALAEEAAAALFARLSTDRAAVLGIIRKLSSKDVFCDGAPVHFDEHYKYSLARAFKVATCNFEVQYSSFLSELGLPQLDAGSFRGMADKIAKGPTGATIPV